MGITPEPDSSELLHEPRLCLQKRRYHRNLNIRTVGWTTGLTSPPKDDMVHHAVTSADTESDDSYAECISHRYYFGFCLQELAACVPPPLATPRNTRQATTSHGYCVAIGNSRVSNHSIAIN